MKSIHYTLQVPGGYTHTHTHTTHWHTHSHTHGNNNEASFEALLERADNRTKQNQTETERTEQN